MMLHPLLTYNPAPMLKFNVSMPTSHIVLRPDCSPGALSEPATNPPVQRLELTVSGIMWTIEAVNPHGVTVSDVFNAIFANLNLRITHQEYVRHNPRAQHEATIAFMDRGTGGRSPTDGLRRIDFVGQHFMFLGLSQTNDGTRRWVIQLH